MDRQEGAVPTLRQQWDALREHPDGKRRFSAGLGQLAPYTATIEPEVVELESGYCKVRMQDRPGVRNHLDSIHAIALVNLAELTSGLALIYGAPEDSRSILVGLGIEYAKKARGAVTAVCRCEAPPSNESREYEYDVTVCDESGDTVATARVRWLIGPR